MGKSYDIQKKKRVTIKKSILRILLRSKERSIGLGRYTEVNDEANIDMLTAILRTKNKYSLLQLIAKL